MTTAAERWVEAQASLAEPAHIYWCDGSDGEGWRLLEVGLREETLNGPVFHELNHKTWPTAYLHRSSPTDVARTEHQTFGLLGKSRAGARWTQGSSATKGDCPCTHLPASVWIRPIVTQAPETSAGPWGLRYGLPCR